MNIFDTTKSLLENAYFFSGPILAILSLFIFRQIKLAKNHLIIAKRQLEENQKQLKITSLRQAATLSADLSKNYIDEIIPLANELYEAKEKANYSDIKVEIKNFLNDELKDWDIKSLDTYLNRPDNIGYLELRLLNKMEAFSIYFIKGVADETVAFTSLGTNFCKYVESNYPTLALLRGSKNPHKNYDNLVALYKCWKQRINSSIVNSEKEELSKELKQKIQQLEELKSESQPFDQIKPIGT